MPEIELPCQFESAGRGYRSYVVLSSHSGLLPNFRAIVDTGSPVSVIPRRFLTGADVRLHHNQIRKSIALGIVYSFQEAIVKIYVSDGANRSIAIDIEAQIVDYEEVLIGDSSSTLPPLFGLHAMFPEGDFQILQADNDGASHKGVLRIFHPSPLPPTLPEPLFSGWIGGEDIYGD